MSDFWIIPSSASRPERKHQQEGESFFSGEKKDKPFFTPPSTVTMRNTGHVHGGQAGAAGHSIQRAPAVKESPLTNMLQEEEKPPLHRKPAFESDVEEPVQRKCAACETEEALQPKAMEEDEMQRKEIDEEENPTLHLKPAFESEAEEPVQSKCAACETEEALQPKAMEKDEKQRKEIDEEENPTLHLKPAFESDAEEPVQRKCAACETEEQLQKKPASGSPYNNHLEGQLQSTRNGGSSMPADVQHNMESAFGADFGNVRIHDNKAASDMSTGLHAQAFTHGNNIYFNKNKYQPHTTDGQRLLAHELTHVVQQGGAATKDQAIQKTEKAIQTYPQAGEVLPATSKQRRYYRHRNEVVELYGKSSFKPGSGLGNYISSMWENGQDVAVNVRFGSLGPGYLWLDKNYGYISSACVTYGFVNVCKDFPPSTAFYNATEQVIPIKHDAFPESDKGTVVLKLRIMAGVISGVLGFVPNKKPDTIEPLMDAGLAITNEAVFLPLIYGDDYTGENYASVLYENELKNGFLKFLSAGDLFLPNQQKIEGLLLVISHLKHWVGTLKGKAVGLDEYEFPVDRNSSKAELHGEGKQFQLDKQWTTGNKDGEKGVFTASAEIRASYKNRTFEFFGKATYASARINGEVNLALVPRSKANDLFKEHAPGKQSEAAQTSSPAPSPDGEETTGEPLALTGYGNLTFKLIQRQTPDPQQAPGTPGTPPPDDLAGEGAFAVSPEGYIVLSGKLKLPANYKLTPVYSYDSKDADDKSKHLFEQSITIVRVPVPGGKIDLSLGIAMDLATHINPLELYEIEVAGVYSNHPEYRSEVSITPRLYISGFASATISVSAIAAAKALGLIKVGSVIGSLAGTAPFNAYINAEPTIKMIWDKDQGGDKPASYAIEGTAHAAGHLDFALSGYISVEILSREVLKKEVEFATWTLANFGLLLKLNEYILGSDKKPELDYSKIKFGKGQRRELGKAVATGKHGKTAEKQLKGGFQQIEDGKKVEKGEISHSALQLPDGNEKLDYDLEQEFLMQDKLHELSVSVDGTRNKPVATVEMASKRKRPLIQKIAEEKSLLAFEKMVADEEREKEIAHRENDLNSIAREAASVEQNAESAAQQVKGDEEPAVAGFDRLDDRLNTYAARYNTDDLGVDLSVNPPAKAQALKVPISNGASGEMERRLKDERQRVGWQHFEDFKGTNVAIFRYYVLEPDANRIDENADGPFYEAAVNVAKELHSEEIIAGRLQEIHNSREFRKKYGPGHRIIVDQVLTERSPCSKCRRFLVNNPSSLIITTNYHTFYLEHYSGNWIERNRNLMIRYGLEPPPIEELRRQYGGVRKPDPH